MVWRGSRVRRPERPNRDRSSAMVETRSSEERPPEDSGMTTSHELAARLVQWHDERRPFIPFAKQAGIADLNAAYDVQDTFVAHCRQRRQSRVVGYKVGLTSPRMQAMCGIDTPVAGVVLAADVHASSASIRLG